MAATTLADGAPAVSRSSNTRRPSRYEAPFRLPGNPAQEDSILAWMREAISEGEWFLKSQSGYRFVDASHRIMADIGFDQLPSTLSKASVNFIKRDTRELVGTLSNPRPMSSFKCDNQLFDQTADVLNRLYQNWYFETFVDRQIRGALQYSAVEGTGYLLTEWDPQFWGTGRGDIRCLPLGVDAVLPIQISPEGWDLQEAYAVIIRRQVPMTWVLRRFPQFRDKLSPDGESVNRFRRLVNNMMDKVAATVHNTYGSQRGYRGEDPATRSLITVHDIYIMDASVNITGSSIKMGIPGSPWEYTVPSYGSEIPIAVNNPATGQPMTRRADMHDARLFPYRRHIVATRNVVLYDDTSRWWHGQIPLVKFRLDDWPFEYCGIPVTKDPAKAQAMMTSLLRAYDDSANARLRPPIVWDGSRFSTNAAKSFDPRSGGQVIEASNLLGDAFKLAVDPRYYQMQADILELINWIKEEGTKLMGLHDLKAMQDAAQIPSSDTIEKLAEIAGPIATDMSRNMEAALRCLGEQFNGLAFEFYNARRRFQILGPDGLTREDFDFDPGTLIPRDLDLPGLGAGGTRSERGRAHMQNFQYTIVPNSVYQITQSTRRLLNLQLARMGFPVSPYTILEQFDIPNPGKAPVGANTEIEKWKAWQSEQLDVMIQQQMKLAQAQMAMQTEAAMTSPLGQLSDAIRTAVQTPPGGGPGGKPQEGRPPTAQEPPKLKTKDGGTRSTISESG